MMLFMFLSCTFCVYTEAGTMSNHQNFMFRRVTESDLPLLFTWFNEEHVKYWWPVPTQYENFFESFLARIRSKDTVPFLVFLHDAPLGYIQYYHIDRTLEKAGAWLPELPPTTVGIDQFIGDATCIGKGYGTMFIKDFITYLTCTLEPSITTIIVDPDPENKAAIRCYEKVGFEHIGVYEAPWGPAVLMRYDVENNNNEQGT